MTEYKYLTEQKPNKNCIYCRTGKIHYTCTRIDTEDPLITSCEVDGCKNLLSNYKLCKYDKLLCKNIIIIYCEPHIEEMDKKWEADKIQDKKDSEIWLKESIKRRKKILEKIELVREQTKNKYKNLINT